MTDQLDQQLWQAAQTGNLEAVNEALSQGANVNTPGALGDTALNLAAEYGHFEVVLRLLDAEADIEHLGGGQKTPLMNATFAGQTPVVKLLLSRGARISRDLLSSLELKVSIAEENAEADWDYVVATAWRALLEYMVAQQNPRPLPKLARVGPKQLRPTLASSRRASRAVGDWVPSPLRGSALLMPNVRCGAGSLGQRWPSTQKI